MNLLVTGGAGFLGSHFVRSLLADRLPGLQGAQVTVIDKLSYAASFANLGAVAHDKRLDFVPGDVADAALADVVMRGHDAVVNFAAETSVDRSLISPDTFMESNVLGTQVLLDAARRHGVDRFVQISSDAVYGPLETGAHAEDAPLAPTSPYAATKATADLLALAAHRTHGLGAVVVRVCSVFGPGQHPEKFFPRVVTSVLTGRPVVVNGSVRDWLHVADCSQAVGRVVAGGRAGEVYHVGGSIELGERDVAGVIVAELGVPEARIEASAVLPGHDQRRALSDEKLRSEFGWYPGVEFDSGVAGTVRWYRDHPSAWGPLLEG
ncbi:dTDP-glucose 4,6-dehydratase [Actinoplanes sp. NPDC051343]|uniref:dTDP-glucose 4,6-dehydratase n=1 Tax=Actinoplanes sp. NPDC051343 TaxID=3363906 RepID=UPI0037B34B8B